MTDDYGSGCAILVRIYHCVADGIALARVMLTLTDGGEPHAGIADARDGNGGRLRALGSVARLAGVVVHEGVETLLHPEHAGQLASTAVGDAQTLAGLLLPAADPHTAKPLPRELGNHFGLVLLGLPVGIEDPVARLAEVKRRMDAIKDSHEGTLAYGILSLIGRTPVQVEERLIDFFSAKGSMVLTNVPGPRQRLSLAGTRLAGVLVWAPCSGSVAMSVSIFSYAGSVTVGLLADAGLVPAPQELADGFRRELLGLARVA